MSTAEFYEDLREWNYPGEEDSSDWEPRAVEFDPQFDKWLDLLCLCYEAATGSPDTSTQLGVVLVNDEEPLIATLAFNGFTQGWVPEPGDYERPRKYELTEHAERRAIYQAARYGIATEGLTMVATWAACADCARAIVEAGISTLVRHHVVDEDTQHWQASIQLGDQILRAGGVEIIDVTGYIPNAPPILRGGKTFYPDIYTPKALTKKDENEENS